MTDKRAKLNSSDWRDAQNDAQLVQSELIDIARLLARRAAERDLKQHMEGMDKERTGTDD